MDTTTTRPFQGTIAAQITIEAANDYEAQDKLRAAARYLAAQGITVDQWSIPMVRDVIAQPADGRDRYTVLTAYEVEASDTGTARCAAYEAAGRVAERIEERNDNRALRRAENRLEAAQEAVAQAEAILASRQAFVAQVTDEVKRATEVNEGWMEQGRIVRYDVIDAQRGSLLPTPPTTG